VLAIVDKERREGGEIACVVQFGGQTPLKLALDLQAAGVDILGTSPDSIDLAEDRERFSALLWDLGIPQPPSGMATSATRRATSPHAWAIRWSCDRPTSWAAARWRSSTILPRWIATWRRGGRVAGTTDPRRQVPRGRVRARRRRDRRRVGGRRHRGIMEHIEEAGIHSGDSSCVVPPYLVPERHLARFATTPAASGSRSRSSA